MKGRRLGKDLYLSTAVMVECYSTGNGYSTEIRPRFNQATDVDQNARKIKKNFLFVCSFCFCERYKTVRKFSRQPSISRYKRTNRQLLDKKTMKEVKILRFWLLPTECEGGQETGKRL